MVCSHAKHDEISKLLFRGVSLVRISNAYNISKDALIYHRDACFTPALQAEVMRQIDEENGTLYKELAKENLRRRNSILDEKKINERLNSIGLKLEKMIKRVDDKVKGSDLSLKELDLAASALSKMANSFATIMKVCGQMMGKIDESPKIVNIHYHESFLKLSSILIEELPKYPEAMETIMPRIKEIEETISTIEDARMRILS